MTEARAPLEIKVAESWSLKELETALIAQLRGRYPMPGRNPARLVD